MIKVKVRMRMVTQIMIDARIFLDRRFIFNIFHIHVSIISNK